ncbi:MAG: hypothetical protein PUB22_10040 [Clostridiales bacterium]|nr:hypothetical protein [Clostridiales bacterium]
MKNSKKKTWLKSLLSMLAMMIFVLAMSGCAVQPNQQRTVKQIKSIRAYSELTYYAVAVTKVDVTYKKGVDLSTVKASDYHLIDRGYLSPEFGELPIDDVEVNGQTVTLTINRDTTANEDNALIYAGENATGSRSKDDIYGVHASFSWYRQRDGKIVEAARAFQYRDTELKLWHEGENPEKAICQSDDETGKYLKKSKFKPTEIEYFTNVEKASFEKDGKTFNYSVGGLMTLEDLGIEIPSSSGIEGDNVMAYVAFPRNYDPNKEYPIILSLPGNNAAMWDIVDENGEIIADNPYGPTFFNGSTINWYDKGVDAIAVYVSHRYYSQYAGAVAEPTDLSLEGYNYVKDDMAIVDYFVENYGAKENHVVLTGDSRGTKSASNIIKAYPGRISTFLCLNGTWGGWGQWGAEYTAEDFYTAGKYGTSVWFFDGELDFDNQENITLAREQYAKAGRTQEEIDDMLRISCLDTHYNYYWADTDHSATKFVYWYLMDNIYYGPGHIENGEIVYDSTDIDKYQFNGKLNKDGSYELAGFDYKVYTDTLIDWVMSEDREKEPLKEKPSVDNIKSIQPHSELTYYAVAVTQVDITYEDDVDLSGVTADDFHLIDRGYLKPEFGQLPIENVEVEGQTVTLTINRDTTANEDNAYYYAGENATGSRSKDDIYGVHACFAWYRQLDGTIVESSRAFQYRDTELKFWHEGEDPEKALCQSDDATGKYVEGSKILPTEIEYFTNVEKVSFEKEGQTFNYTKGGFMTLEQLGIQIPSSSGIEGDYVKAYVSFPEGYDPNKKYPLVVSLPGNSAAEWDIVDENGKVIATNPYGATFFNGSVINWYDKGYDVITMYISHHYYSQLCGAVENECDLSLEGYNYLKDDMAAIDYFIENYGAKENHVIVTGDSRGTMAGSNLVKAYPGRISTFLCLNGDWGVRVGYTPEDYELAAEYGLSVWCMDGEQDSNNQSVITNARKLYSENGIEPDNLRHSDIATDYNYYWADTDHSVTKFAYWYLMDTIYYGPGHIENGQIIYDSTDITEYESQGQLQKDGTWSKEGYKYQVYTDTMTDWALSEDREIEVWKPGTEPENPEEVKVTVDGKEVEADVYVEDGAYMKIDELAALLAGTGSAFDVAVDKNQMTVHTHLGAEYKEGVAIDSEPPAKAPAGWTLTIDGVTANLIRTHVEGEDLYFNLRDIAVLYGFDAAFDAEAKTLDITSGTGYSIELDPDDYETGTIKVYGEDVNYKVYTQVYVTDPNCVAREVMKIYVPETADENSPIMMPLKTGAHRHAEMAELVNVDESNINIPSSGTVGTGAMQAASYLMSKGWVVMSAAARGQDTIKEVDGVKMNVGLAPACVTDMKAAIRFMRYNDDVIPGDPDKIVVTGTSGGGTMTSVLGASGNSEYYEPYLEEIGAADAADNVYAAVPYCPVADIDNQGASYEWVFQGYETPNRTGNMGILSEESARVYTSYVNGLGLHDEWGNALTLNPKTLDGSYKVYFCSKNAEALTNYMKSNGYVAKNGNLTKEGREYFNAKIMGRNENFQVVETNNKISDAFVWSPVNGGHAVLPLNKYGKFLEIYYSQITRMMKGCPSFDNGLVYGDVTTPAFDLINVLFGTDPFDLSGWSHFEMNLGKAVANANKVIGSDYFASAKGSFEISDESQKLIAMYNPMYYIRDYSGVAAEGLAVNSYADDMFGSSDPAPYWHLRVGTWDHLVSTSTETTFALALNDCEDVEECDFSIYWNQPHTGWYDNTEMIEWLTSLPGLGGNQ